MEVEAQLNKENNIRYHKITGLINVNELMNKLGVFYKSSDYDPDMNSLWDLRFADFSAVKPDAVRALVDLVKQYWGKEKQSKSALVVQSDFEYGLSRMYEILMTLSNSGNVTVFRNYNEAEKWLK